MPESGKDASLTDRLTLQHLVFYLFKQRILYDEARRPARPL